MLLPFLWIGPHREPVVARALELRLRFERGHRDTDVEGEDAVLVGEQRVDVEAAHLRDVGRKLGKLDQGQSDIRDLDGGHVAIALEYA